MAAPVSSRRSPANRWVDKWSQYATSEVTHLVDIAGFVNFEVGFNTEKQCRVVLPEHYIVTYSSKDKNNKKKVHSSLLSLCVRTEAELPEAVQVGTEVRGRDGESVICGGDYVEFELLSMVNDAAKLPTLKISAGPVRVNAETKQREFMRIDLGRCVRQIVADIIDDPKHKGSKLVRSRWWICVEVLRLVCSANGIDCSGLDTAGAEPLEWVMCLVESDGSKNDTTAHADSSGKQAKQKPKEKSIDELVRFIDAGGGGGGKKGNAKKKKKAKGDGGDEASGPSSTPCWDTADSSLDLDDPTRDAEALKAALGANASIASLLARAAQERTADATAGLSAVSAAVPQVTPACMLARAAQERIADAAAGLSAMSAALPQAAQAGKGQTSSQGPKGKGLASAAVPDTHFGKCSGSLPQADQKAARGTGVGYPDSLTALLSERMAAAEQETNRGSGAGARDPLLLDRLTSLLSERIAAASEEAPRGSSAGARDGLLPERIAAAEEQATRVSGASTIDRLNSLLSQRSQRIAAADGKAAREGGAGTREHLRSSLSQHGATSSPAWCPTMDLGPALVDNWRDFIGLDVQNVTESTRPLRFILSFSEENCCRLIAPSHHVIAFPLQLGAQTICHSALLTLRIVTNPDIPESTEDGAESIEFELLARDWEAPVHTPLRFTSGPVRINKQTAQRESMLLDLEDCVRWATPDLVKGVICGEEVQLLRQRWWLSIEVLRIICHTHNLDDRGLDLPKAPPLEWTACLVDKSTPGIGKELLTEPGNSSAAHWGLPAWR